MRDDETPAVALEAVDQGPAPGHEPFPERERAVGIRPPALRASALAQAHRLAQPFARARRLRRRRRIVQLGCGIEHGLLSAPLLFRFQSVAQAQPRADVCRKLGGRRRSAGDTGRGFRTGEPSTTPRPVAVGAIKP